MTVRVESAGVTFVIPLLVHTTCKRKQINFFFFDREVARGRLSKIERSPLSHPFHPCYHGHESGVRVPTTSRCHHRLLTPLAQTPGRGSRRQHSGHYRCRFASGPSPLACIPRHRGC